MGGQYGRHTHALVKENSNKSQRLESYMTPTICFVCDIGEQVNRSVAPTAIDHPREKDEDDQGIFRCKF